MVVTCDVILPLLCHVFKLMNVVGHSGGGATPELAFLKMYDAIVIGSVPSLCGSLPFLRQPTCMSLVNK